MMGREARANILFGFGIHDEEVLNKIEAEELYDPMLVQTYSGEEWAVYLALPNTSFMTWECTPSVFNPVQPTELELLAAKHFCLQHNISWKEPKWLLIPSYW